MVPVMFEHTTFLGPEGIQLVLPHCHACIMHVPRTRARPLVVGAAVGMVSGFLGLVFVGFLGSILKDALGNAALFAICLAGALAFGAMVVQLRRIRREDAEVSVRLMHVATTGGAKLVTLSFRSDAYAQRLMALLG